MGTVSTGVDNFFRVGQDDVVEADIGDDIPGAHYQINMTNIPSAVSERTLDRECTLRFNFFLFFMREI
jgi:hypothetical protein